MASVWVKRELDSLAPRSVIATFAGMRYAIAVHCPRTNRRLPRDRRENHITVVTSCLTRVAVKSPEPTVAAVVRQQTGVAWSRARGLCTEGRVTLNGQRCLDPASRVAPGTVVAVDQRATKLRTGPLAESAIVFYDRDVVIDDKPAGMLRIADEAGNKETIVDYTRTLLRQMGGHVVDAKLGVVHRLDKDTSGLMVFARTAHAKRTLAAQF